MTASEGMDLELDEHEEVLLLEACRTVDLLESLEESVRTEGAIIDSPQGRRAHPAVVELRQQRIALARLMGVLRLPTGEDEAVRGAPAGRAQRRVGARGVYGMPRSS